jgi:hypothetical protein
MYNQTGDNDIVRIILSIAFEQRRTSIDSSWYLSEIITCAILVKPSSAFSLFLFIALSCVFF